MGHGALGYRADLCLYHLKNPVTITNIRTERITVITVLFITKHISMYIAILDIPVILGVFIATIQFSSLQFSLNWVGVGGYYDQKIPHHRHHR